METILNYPNTILFSKIAFIFVLILISILLLIRYNGDDDAKNYTAVFILFAIAEVISIFEPTVSQKAKYHAVAFALFLISAIGLFIIQYPLYDSRDDNVDKIIGVGTLFIISTYFHHSITVVYAFFSILLILSMYWFLTDKNRNSIFIHSAVAFGLLLISVAISAVIKYIHLESFSYVLWIMVAQLIKIAAFVLIWKAITDIYYAKEKEERVMHDRIDMLKRKHDELVKAKEEAEKKKSEQNDYSL